MEALAFKEHALRLFLANGSDVLTRRVILWSLPNGDWRKWDIEYFPDVGHVSDPAIAMKTMQVGLCNALAGSKLKQYKRALDRVILSHRFVRFARVLPSTPIIDFQTIFDYILAQTTTVHTDPRQR